jgi:hypothetical protein
MLELVLSEARAAPGTVVHGRLVATGERGRGAVELVRVEQSPLGVASYQVATAALAADGTFELLIPDGVPPDVRGRDCSLRYALRASAGGEELLEAFTVST